MFALTPKCFLCLLAYATAGTALRLGGPEICGAPSGGAHGLMWLLAFGLAIGAISLVSFRCGRTGLRSPVCIVPKSRV